MKRQKPTRNNLVLYRRRMHLTQRQVARILGRHDISMISHYEHGRALPPLSVALSLEILYRVPVAFLFPDMYDDLRQRIRRNEEIAVATVQAHILQATNDGRP